MINLFFAIVFSSALYVVFRSFKKLNIETFQAIVVNYIIAFSIGILQTSNPINWIEIPTKKWFAFSLILGLLFILVFYIIGKTTQINGLTVSSVASKMSMIIPAIFGILYFHENSSATLLFGIFLALLSVYFVSKKKKEKSNLTSFKNPLLLFLGAGTIDTLINFTQQTSLDTNETSLFSAFTFLFAFVFGLIFLIVKFLKKQIKVELRNIAGGILLGVPNYFSLYFLTKALQIETLESPSIFTIINIGVILLSTLVGISIFNEKLSKQNYIGIILALFALYFVTLK